MYKKIPVLLGLALVAINSSGCSINDQYSGSSLYSPETVKYIETADNVAKACNISKDSCMLAIEGARNLFGFTYTNPYTTPSGASDLTDKEVVKLQRPPKPQKVTNTNNSQRYETQVPDNIVVHYTALGPTHGVKEIHKSHRTKGWAGVGYHYVIEHPSLHGDTNDWRKLIVKGRPNDMVGAGVYGHNTNTLHVVIADDNKSTLEDSQRNALIQTVLVLAKHYNISLDKIHGHGELNSTQCPGVEGYKLVNELRQGKHSISSDALEIVSRVPIKLKFNNTLPDDRDIILVGRSSKPGDASREVKRECKRLAYTVALQQKVPANLFVALIVQESALNPSAKSSAGAVGLGQLMEGTAKKVGVHNRYSAKQNLVGSAKLLRILLLKYNGNISLALAAYNAGEGAVSKYNGVPPYKQTLNYIKKIRHSANV